MQSQAQCKSKKQKYKSVYRKRSVSVNAAGKHAVLVSVFKAIQDEK
jgi:hypothetical protein